jgi:hypothetical protein
MQPLLGNAFTYKHVPMETNPDTIMEELLEALRTVRAKGLSIRQVQKLVSCKKAVRESVKTRLGGWCEMAISLGVRQHE